MFKEGRVTVSGKEDVESDNWAKVVVQIVNANTRPAKKNSGGRGGFRYRFLGEPPSPLRSFRRIFM